MGVNKLTIDGTVEFDLSSDTVTAATLAKGITAHNSIGDVITGTLEPLDTSDATANAYCILEETTAYVNGVKITGVMPNFGSSHCYMDSISQVVTIPYGYHDGTGTVRIDPDEVAKLTPTNVRSGVTVLGVTGTLEEKIDTSDATATSSDILSGKTAYVDDVKITGKCTYDADTSDATAVAANLLSGVTAYVDGSKITGTMTNNGTQNLTISTVSGTASIAAGYHSGSGKAQISSTEQAKIIASNIKKGITILGVTGSVQEGVDTSDATASASQILSGNTAYVNGSKLTGTCTYDADTSSATATAAEIASGKTAYVNGTKLTGTLSFRNLYTSTSSPSSADGSNGDIWIITG